MTYIILGGGLSGLSAAYYLLKKCQQHAVTVLEASSRTGGWIQSHIQTDGVIFEQGPRTIRPRGPAGANTLQLLEELDLSNQIIPITSNQAAAQNRMIYAKGSLHMLPSSVWGLFKTQQPFSKPLFFHLLNDLTSARKKVDDESIYDFVCRRFSREVADYLISPLICGVCAGNAQEISVKFLMRRLFEYEQKYGNVTNGIFMNVFTRQSQASSALSLTAKLEKWNIYSFINGCETLPLALKQHISENVQININTECQQITTQSNQVQVTLKNGKIITGKHLISAIPASSLAPLVQKQHSKLAEHLNKITKNVSVVVVNLQFDKTVLQKDAFGLLVAPTEQLPVLGIVFDSCCFPRNDCTLLTVMMGGYWFEQYFGQTQDEQQFLNIALKHVGNILNIRATPTHFKVNVLHNCLPQYVVGHDHNLQEINKYIKNHQLPVSVCGASYDGVGINDVIVSAKNAVNELDYR